MTMCKQVSCDTCYNAYVNVEYHTQGGSPQAATVEVSDCYLMGEHTPDTYPRSRARRNALYRTNVGPASHVLRGLWDSTRVTPPGGAGMTLTPMVCVCVRDAQCDIGLVRSGAHRLLSCVCIRVGTVVFHRGYTVWKWFPFAVPALCILAVMVIVSDRLCARAGRQVCGPRLPTYVGRLATVVLWVGTCC